jgi:hypothetical protein
MNHPRRKRLLKAGIEKSRYAIMINTQTFGESYWTGEEFNHI